MQNQSTIMPVTGPTTGTVMPPPPPGSVGAAPAGNRGVWGTEQDPRLQQGNNNISFPTSGMPPSPPPGVTGGPSNTSPFNALPPPGGASYGGQSTVGASAGPADYEGVRGFADQAYEEARRSIDPQQEQQGRRMEQDLINKGVDPSSPQGKAMLDQQNRNFSAQDNSALFSALQFGQGVQSQMFNQDFQNTQQAGNMQQAKWNYDLGAGNLDMMQQGQDFNQMIGLEGLQFRDRRYGDQRSDYQDALTMSLMGMTPVPGVMGYDPSGLASQQINNSSGGGVLGAL